MRISEYSQSWYQSKNNRVSRCCVVLCTLNTPSHPPGTWKNVENCNLIEKTDFNYLIYVTYHSQFNVPTLLYWYMYITLNYKTSPADWERYFPLSVITLRRLTIKISPVPALKRLSKYGQTPCMNVCTTRIHCQLFSDVYWYVKITFRPDIFQANFEWNHFRDIVCLLSSKMIFLIFRKNCFLIDFNFCFYLKLISSRKKTFLSCTWS